MAEGSKCVDTTPNRVKDIPRRCEIEIRKYCSGCELGGEADFSLFIVEAEPIDLVADIPWQG
jgi:hypothetical protein